MDFDDKSLIRLKEINKGDGLVELVFDTDFEDKNISVSEDVGEVFKKGKAYHGFFKKGHVIPETMEYIVERDYNLIAIRSEGKFLWKYENPN